MNHPRYLIILSFGLVILLSSPLVGQTPGQTEGSSPSTTTEDRQGAIPVRDRLIGAVHLPMSANRTRRFGLPESELQNALRGMHDNELSPAEADDVLTEAGDAIDRHGPVDNFGAFVNEQLASGLRGRELADAIHREHAARGRGRQVRSGPSLRGSVREGMDRPADWHNVRGRPGGSAEGSGRGHRMREREREGSGRGRLRPMRDDSSRGHRGVHPHHRGSQADEE